MTTLQFAAYVAKKRGCSKAIAESWVRLLIEDMFSAFAEGNPLSFLPLGQFHLVMLKGHFGRNSSTGELLVVKPQRTVKFRPSPELKQELAKLKEEEVAYLTKLYLPEGRTDKNKKQKDDEEEIDG